jgi:hypothetical protein
VVENLNVILAASEDLKGKRFANISDKFYKDLTNFK